MPTKPWRIWPNKDSNTSDHAGRKLSLSQAEIARRCGIPAPHLTQMKQGKRRCTPEYDLRLSCFFGITPGLWMNLQLDYEFMRAEREKGPTIRKEVRPCAA
ncbi:MAG: HigA family addiction module antitoxin [Verrucomicrobiota bacterium]